MSEEKAYTVRRLCKGEGKLYRSIRLEALRESPEAFCSSYDAALGRDMESWDNQADAAADGGDRAIFIVQTTEPVGLIALYRDPENPSQGELVQMWIAPSERGSGIAEVLLNHLFEWAAEHSYEAVRAEVTDGNQRALRFYLKYGSRKLESVGTETSLVKSTKDVEIGLRPATAEDLEWLDSFYESLMRPLVELTHPWAEDKFREAFGLGNGMVVTCGGREIGYYKVEDRPDCLYLGDIQIHSDFQNQGIGAHLITDLQSRAANEGRPIRLRVLKANRARLLYERLGFKESIQIDNCHEMEWRPSPHEAITQVARSESVLQ